jgi:transposase
MFNKSTSIVATMGIDIGKNSFHVVGLDERGAIVLRQKWSRGQIEVRLASMPPCLVGMEACVGAHHLSRKLQAHGHDARLMPAKYVRRNARIWLMMPVRCLTSRSRTRSSACKSS